MDDTFFDGHDELYQHAMFGEDPTTCAGCRCENVVFVTMFTGRIAAKRQTAGIKFTHRPKSRFFAPKGRLIAPITSNLAGPTGTWVRLAVQNFTSIVTGGGNVAPKISKISSFWKRVAPYGRLP